MGRPPLRAAGICDAEDEDEEVECDGRDDDQTVQTVLGQRLVYAQNRDKHGKQRQALTGT